MCGNNGLSKEPLNKSWSSRQVPETVKYEAQNAGNIGNISKFCNEVVGCLRELNADHGLIQRFLKYSESNTCAESRFNVQFLENSNVGFEENLYVFTEVPDYRKYNSLVAYNLLYLSSRTMPDAHT